MWMARDRRPESALSPRLLITPQHSDACTRCALLAISGASGARSCEHGQPSYKRTPESRLGTFSGAGNGDYRGELLHSLKAISAYMKAQSVPLNQAVVRLDG